MRRLLDWLLRRAAKRIVALMLGNASMRAQLEQFVDARVRLQLQGPFEIKRR